MGQPTHRVSYEVEFGLLDQALESKKGARVKVRSLDSGQHLRQRLHSARRVDRRDSTRLYDPDHPAHGQSAYDKLVCRIKKVNAQWWLYIEQRNAETFEVEEIEENNPTITPPEEVVEIEAPPRSFRRTF